MNCSRKSNKAADYKAMFVGSMGSKSGAATGGATYGGTAQSSYNRLPDQVDL